MPTPGTGDINLMSRDDDDDVIKTQQRNGWTTRKRSASTAEMNWAGQMVRDECSAQSSL